VVSIYRVFKPFEHHGHGGTSDVKNIERDSEKHLQAGAAFSSVEGFGVLLIQNQSQKWSLPEIIAIYEQFS
jgi:molybdopterin-guanine dinucleotide biosynthesis adapter protein